MKVFSDKSENKSSSSVSEKVKIYENKSKTKSTRKMSESMAERIKMFSTGGENIKKGGFVDKKVVTKEETRKNAVSNAEIDKPVDFENIKETNKVKNISKSLEKLITADNVYNVKHAEQNPDILMELKRLGKYKEKKDE